MNAIIRQQTDQGVKMQRIHKVRIVQYSQNYSTADRKWSEIINLWVNSEKPIKTITLDSKTQIILEGGD